MASLWQKALMYLGLVDEDRVDTEPDQAAPPRTRNVVRQTAETPVPPPNRVAGRRVEPPPVARRPQQTSVSRTPSAVRPVPTMEAQSDVIEPEHFDDARVLADRIRDRVPVVLNMRNTDPDMVRRLVDFCTGLTYALDGSMRKIDEGVILVLPPRVSLGREEKRRLADLGLYALGDEQTE